MKKQMKWLMAVCAACLALGSCVTIDFEKNTVDFDGTVSQEETATLYFFGILPTMYNGRPITSDQWYLSEWGGYNKAFIRFPAGKADFVCNVNYFFKSPGVSQTRWTGKDFTFSYTFEKGVTYYLMFETEGDDWGFKLYRDTYKSKGFIAFIPFTNQNEEKVLK